MNGKALAALVALVSVYYYIVLEYKSSTGLQNPFLRSVSDKYDSLSKGHNKLASSSYLVNKLPPIDRTQVGAENATMVMLVRNRDLKEALQSMRSLEDRFNKHYRYPWVFLNDEPFSQEFKEQTTLMASGKTYYELIPEEDWQPPSFINGTKLDENLENSKDSVIYGGVRSYRNMCHFNSGFFYKQKRLLNYDWYFRVEPDVEYMCDFQYDPFSFLRTNNKVYGFVIAIHEYENTMPTFWETVESFMEEFPHLVHPNNSLDFITTNETSLNHGYETPASSTKYNLCHFWSNFEIANLNFFRGEAYNEYFDYLDKAGGFFYERWGDAPVHSVGLNILLDKNQIYHFEDIGYYHAPYMACPSSVDVLSSKKCVCRAMDDGHFIETAIDVNVYSCLSRWWRYGAGKTFLNDMDYTLS